MLQLFHQHSAVIAFVVIYVVSYIVARYACCGNLTSYAQCVRTNIKDNSQRQCDNVCVQRSHVMSRAKPIIRNRCQTNVSATSVTTDNVKR